MRGMDNSYTQAARISCSFSLENEYMDSFPHLPFFICGLETLIVATILTRKNIFLFAIAQVQLLTGDSRNAKSPGIAAEPAPPEAEINAPSCTLISRLLLCLHPLVLLAGVAHFQACFHPKVT